LSPAVSEAVLANYRKHVSNPVDLLTSKSTRRRFAPLPAPRRSGGKVVATGGAGGNTHGQPAHLEFAELDKHNCLEGKGPASREWRIASGTPAPNTCQALRKIWLDSFAALMSPLK
jgi:hypothetical protein